LKYIVVNNAKINACSIDTANSYANIGNGNKNGI
jgi:hypothetical protein